MQLLLFIQSRAMLSLVFFCLITSSLLQAQCPNLVWSDEFSGNSLDQNNWNYQIGDGCSEGICGWGNNELQSYQQDNVTVSGGTLKIEAKKKRVRGKSYTSGRINSKNKADFTYGRFEARIKLPYGDGLWPAFWMLSTNEPYGGWPQSGEIDIMEFVASNPSQTLGYIHYGDPFPNNQNQGNVFNLLNENFPDAFHDFAIEWEPGEIRWFVDGILFSTKTLADVAPYQWPFDQDMHFLLNVAVGGNLGGPVNDAMLPATMEVDYVRVYDGFRAYFTGDQVVDNQAQGVTYSLENLSNGTNVTWSVPSDATIVSGQGTSSITVDFGDASGAVSASFNDGCTTQNLSLDVEVEQAYTKDYSFENFDDAATAIYATSTGVLTEVNNPSPNATNASALSGKYDRNSSEQYDVLVYDIPSIGDASAYVDKSKKFYVDVYTNAPVGTDILLQLETGDATPSNYPTGRHSRYVATITENNNWHRLAFSLLDRPDVTAGDTDVSSMVILFASNGFTGDTYYFDNLDSYSVGGGTTNLPPTVSISNPSDGGSATEGSTVSITASAADSDGSVSQVEFFVDGNSVGVDASAPYSVDWTVTLGGHSITAVATDDGGASTTSSAVSFTGQSAGNATSVIVASLTTGTAGAGQGNKYGTATVQITDDLGNPVAGAVVTGTFSGTYNESGSGTTDGNGNVTIQTQATAKGGVSVNFCVDNVVASLPYDANSGGFSCGSSARTVSPGELSFGNTLSRADVEVFPNPVREMLTIRGSQSVDLELVEVLNVNGRVLIRRAVEGIQSRIDMSHLAPGLYLLRIKDGNGLIHTKKVIR